jgi:hypothetical protein
MSDRCEACGRADCRDALPYEDSDLRMLIALMDRDSVASAVAHRWVAAEAELTAARETVARMESTLADQLKVTVVARQAVSDVVCQRNAALARVAAMEPVVAACIARAEANDAQEAAKSNGAFAEEFMRWCDADDELGRRVDTFRSTSKPQEPTSE